MERPARVPMAHPPTIKSPPPPYPDAFDRAAHEEPLYGSDSGSLNTIQEHDRRYSVASVASEMVLPHAYPRRGTRASSGSEESSYTFGMPDNYHQRHPDPVMLTPPSGRLSTLEYPNDDGQSVYSYFPADPADDPAVMRSMRSYPSPPSSNYAPSVVSQRSNPSSAPPQRGPMQRSPTLPAHPAQMLSPTTSARSPQPVRPAPLLGLRNTVTPGAYTFRMCPDRTMLLAPPENSADRTPVYKVEVFPNCFMPMVYVTRLHRGNGSYVGQFEMGISKDQPQLYMEPQWYQLKDVFSPFRKIKSSLGDRWIWQRGKVKLEWDCRTESELSCYGGDDRKVIAQFRPAGTQPIGTFANGPPQNILEIHTTMDHNLLDEIVMSVLIAERRRAVPRKANEEMFN